MKKLKLTTFLITIVAVAACMEAVLFAPTVQAQETGKNYAISGVLFNNGKPFGVFGYGYRATEHLAYFVQSEIGGDDQAIGGSPIITFGISRRITIGALLGPQIEIVQQNPTTSETLTYLGATTGIIAIYKVSDQTGIWLGIRHLIVDADLKPFKVGVGLILDIK